MKNKKFPKQQEEFCCSLSEDILWWASDLLSFTLQTFMSVCWLPTVNYSYNISSHILHISSVTDVTSWRVLSSLLLLSVPPSLCSSSCHHGAAGFRADLWLLLARGCFSMPANSTESSETDWQGIRCKMLTSYDGDMSSHCPVSHTALFTYHQIWKLSSQPWFWILICHLKHFDTREVNM